VPCKLASASKLFAASLMVLAAAFAGGCGSSSSAKKTASQSSAVDPDLAPLGEPRRNVVSQARTPDVIAAEVVAQGETRVGTIPIMIFPSKNLIVENVYNLVADDKICRDAFANYDAKLVAENGDKIRHGLYCVGVAIGKVGVATPMATSFP
jgi:hypothetical protein